MTSPEEPGELPEFESDPEILALLDFVPVVRKVVRPDGWNRERQIEFIRRLARCGSPFHAVSEMGKNLSGIQDLYRVKGADSFRAAWDEATAIGLRRMAKAEAGGTAYFGPVPGIATRIATAVARAKDDEDWEEPDPNEEQMWDLIHNIGIKFMRKIAAEREARLGGEIVAADFYLRQITFLEMTFDLTATAFGWDARWALKKLQRSDHDIMDIVSTPLADWMDRSRRMWWLQEGEPERPPHPDVRFLQRHGTEDEGCSTYVDQHCTGALTTPARGFSAEEWAAMNMNEQLAARQRQYDEDAAEQVQWESRAHSEWKERNEEE